MYILQVMSSNRHRKRSRSRDSSRQHSSSKKQKSSSHNDNSQEMLSTMLSTLQDLKYEIYSCNKRIQFQFRKPPDASKRFRNPPRGWKSRDRRTGWRHVVSRGGKRSRRLRSRSNGVIRFTTTKRRFPAAKISCLANNFGYSATNFGYSATKFGFSATKFG